MHRTPLAIVLPLAAALCLGACSTAGSARRAQLRRGLDQARVARSAEEIWPEVQRFLNERGYPLVGDDRVAIGQKPQGAIGRALSRGHETRVSHDGTRTLETDMDRSRLRIRAEARPLPDGGTRIRLYSLKERELNAIDFIESRDDELELELLRRLDPTAAAVAAGEAPPGPAAAPSPAQDPWGQVRPLLGAWSGTLPGGGQVRWQFAFTEGGRFLEVRGTPLLFAGPTARAAAGEEMGRISREASGARLAWSQFTYGGAVDRWQSAAPRGDALVFEADAPESLPAGSRARLTLTPVPEGGLRAVLDLAEPGKELATAGEVRLKRGE